MCNSLLVFHCNYVSRTVSEIFNVKINNDVTLKSELWVVQDHRKWYHSKAWVRFPISHFQSSHDPILYQFRDKARYWSKIAIFFHTPWALIQRPRWFGVDRMVWLPDD